MMATMKQTHHCISLIICILATGLTGCRTTPENEISQAVINLNNATLRTSIALKDGNAILARNFLLVEKCGTEYDNTDWIMTGHTNSLLIRLLERIRHPDNHPIIDLTPGPCSPDNLELSRNRLLSLQPMIEYRGAWR